MVLEGDFWDLVAAGHCSSWHRDTAERLNVSGGVIWKRGVMASLLVCRQAYRAKIRKYFGPNSNLHFNTL